MTLEVICRTPEDTLAVGDVIGRLATPGLLVTLQGPLGAGKTVLAKGIARGLGVPEWRYVTSPTFALHNVYRGRLRLHHVDLYRLAGPAEMEGLGLEDVLHGEDVCVIEWPDIFFEELPPERVSVRFRWGAAGERVLVLAARGEMARALVSEAGAVPSVSEGGGSENDV